MRSDNMSVTELRGAEVNFTEEARQIQSRAIYRRECVVRLGSMVFFATATGDAWMLDSDAGWAACVAMDGKTRPIPIQETAAKLTIGWNTDYKIEGEAFMVVERGTGAARTILGYPTEEIQRLVREFPAVPVASLLAAEQARKRLESGRNDPCPCGSGKKYKKCCLDEDVALHRRAAEARQTRTVQRAEAQFASPTVSPEKALGQAELFEGEDFDDEMAIARLPKIQRKLDQLWEEFQNLKKPTAEQMDTFLAKLLDLHVDATDWNELLHEFARCEHPDLPGVFHRIAAAVPHTQATGMSFFYWGAAEEFFSREHRHLLPEVAAGFQKLDAESYDPDAFDHLEDYLLAEGFEAEALELAERFLPVQRVDGKLVRGAVPHLCRLIFELRVGLKLRAPADPARAPERVAEELRRNIEEEIHPDAARHAAEIITGQSSAPVWTRPQFELGSGDISKNDKAWQESLRLSGALMGVAREAWQTEQRPPGCVLRGLTLMLNSVCHWIEADRHRRKKASRNLLTYLRPAEIEERVAVECRGILSVNVPRARLLLEAHGVLLRFATRHQLFTTAEAAQSDQELTRLLHELDGRG